MKSIKKGFTLIELLIVITIIGILAVAFVPQILGAPSKARDTQRITHVQKLASVFTQQSIASTLPAGPACVVNTEGTLGLSQADFGGNIPTDPDATNALPAAGGITCTGQYLYVDAPAAAGVDSDYAFGIYAHVENWETANAVCSDSYTGMIDKPVQPGVDGNGDPTGDAETDWCYAILVQ